MSSENRTPTETVPDPHARPGPEVLDALGTDPTGLTADEAAARLDRHGPNALPTGESESALVRFLRQFKDPMIYVLLGAAVLTTVMGQVVDTIVILAVVLVNAIIGYVQEGRAADALESIRSMLSLDAQVRRDGAWRTVPAEELVPGDVVRLAAGDRVPADVRILEASNLSAEESALTGESLAVEKTPEPVDAEAALGDRSAMAFSGTTLASGSGTGVVTATGTGTEIGHITSLLGEVESMETPLTRQMSAFSTKLSLVVVAAAVVMFVLGGVMYDYGLGELVLAAIGFAVAAIPEGLPAVLTITLALGVQTMAKRNSITRRMNSVETLGSVTVIASDKTGTLTKNEMTVRTVVTADGAYEVTGTGYAPDGEIRCDGRRVDDVRGQEDLHLLAEVAARTNDSTVSREGDAWVLSGEPTDGGLRTFAMKAGIDGDDAHRLAVVPFDSAYKYMATLDEIEGIGRIVNLKGAPDRLLERCDLSADERTAWEARIDELSGRGLRVLAAATRRARSESTHLTTEDVDAGGFTFRGLYGIIDPPREEAIEAIRTVQRAGIRVLMITGDHAGTATAIGREMGITDEFGAVTGAELDTADDAEFAELARTRTVFARTSPEHKLRLVTALQEQGEVVSMTGDGVNDAPSLKKADVGVAMGIKGTEATKEAADVVLADDNFATIGAAVEMGRTIYDNLRKAIVFILPTNGAQGLVILVAVLLGMTLPLTPVQVLWVNTITAVTLALALAFEPGEPDIMDRPPRRPGGSILSGAGITRIVYVSVLLGAITIAVFLGGQSAGVALEVSRTTAVNTLVVGQIFYLLASRFSAGTSLRKELFTTNPISWLCIAVMLLLQAAFVYLPLLQTAFGSAAVGWAGWLIPLGAGVVVLAVVEVDKALRRRR
ncbi:HAD-IC family P-type ATPase [Brachybacterium aquaticum]|uniref:Magnesium-transporting ATPase (P-type) n=1 Tax=Brachybacterium aquaticum TaxID=1432564 RepID=A0A841AC18_9MICO|nr:HAD-IC family P-type ATPase [Brachybacterium aquaticum]MBB5832376.1 magnesium-transporting ATPase (P-type) [Brachybacterium aquaticum]